MELSNAFHCAVRLAYSLSSTQALRPGFQHRAVRTDQESSADLQGASAAVNPDAGWW